MLHNLKILALLGILLIITYTDIRSRIIPNKVLIISAALGLILNLIIRDLSFISVLLGSMFGGGSLLLIAILTKGGIGGGDIKLMATMGLYLGFKSTVIAICVSFIVIGFIASILVIFKMKSYKDTIILGPYFSVGILITIFFMIN